jgi:hypothetical protein
MMVIFIFLYLLCSFSDSNRRPWKRVKYSDFVEKPRLLISVLGEKNDDTELNDGLDEENPDSLVGDNTIGSAYINSIPTREWDIIFRPVHIYHIWSSNCGFDKPFVC